MHGHSIANCQVAMHVTMRVVSTNFCLREGHHQQISLTDVLLTTRCAKHLLLRMHMNFFVNLYEKKISKQFLCSFFGSVQWNFLHFSQKDLMY